MYCTRAFYTALTERNLRVYRAFLTRVYPKNSQLVKEEFAASFADESIAVRGLRAYGAVCVYEHSWHTGVSYVS